MVDFYVTLDHAERNVHAKHDKQYCENINRCPPRGPAAKLTPQNSLIPWVSSRPRRETPPKPKFINVFLAAPPRNRFPKVIPLHTHCRGSATAVDPRGSAAE
jgi:hypothetical protein